MLGVGMLSLGSDVEGAAGSRGGLWSIAPLGVGREPVGRVVGFAKHGLRRRTGLRGAEARGRVREVAGLLLGGPLARSGLLIGGVEVARHGRVGSLARGHIRVGSRREFG